MPERVSGPLRRMRTSILTTKFLRAYVVIPLAVLTIYLVASSLLLPDGINKVFATRSAGYLLPVTLLLLAVTVIGARLKWIRPGQPSPAEDRLSASDALLLLLPLSPVMQYVATNADILSPLDIALVLGFFALLACLTVLVIPAFFRKIGATRPLMYMGLALTSTLANMAILAEQFGWHEWGSLKIQLPVLGGLWLLSWLLFRLNLRIVLHLMIVASFAVNVAAQLYRNAPPTLSDDGDQPANGLAALIGARRPVVTPNIYLLIYDSYVVSETMAGYGIDNTAQEKYLEGLGFKLYPRTYTLGGSTLESLSRLFNSSATYDLEAEGRRVVAGEGMVQKLLSGFGYRTYGVFRTDFLFRGTIPRYDYAFPGHGSPAALLITAILEGEFRFDIGFDQVTPDQFAQERARVFSESAGMPKFVFTLVPLPAHGTPQACRPNEMELYGQRVAQANLEMRNDVETILEHDPQAILIVAGDHGPRRTKNCGATQSAYDISEISRLDLQDRYGAFLAIRWPSEGYEQYDHITILQDLFPSILAYMFADPGLLQASPEPVTAHPILASGAQVDHGLIVGGIDDGEPLFLDGVAE